jgi:hypothetical protein
MRKASATSPDTGLAGGLRSNVPKHHIRTALGVFEHQCPGVATWSSAKCSRVRRPCPTSLNHKIGLGPDARSRNGPSSGRPPPPSDPATPWLSWQGQADFWAASVGMPRVWGSRARSMTLKGAQQILALHQVFEDEPDISPGCRQLIFEAGANGEGLPACAKKAYSALLGVV